MANRAATVLWCWLVFFAPFCQAASLSPELSALQAKLQSHEQLRVSGEQGYFVPATAARASQFEKFTLLFDRSSQRLRLSYSRFSGDGQRVDVDAWGTTTCLNLLRAERSPPGIVRAKSDSCVKVDLLYSLLSDGTPVPSAPTLILSSAIQNSWLERIAKQRYIAVSRDKSGTHKVVASGNDATSATRYRLSASDDLVESVSAGGTGYKLRASYVYHAEPVRDAEFNFKPDEEVEALADAMKDPRVAREQLERLSKNGNKAALLLLAYSDPQSVAVLFGGPPRGNPEQIEQAWKALDNLAHLGFGSAYAAEARWVAQSPSSGLPAQFANEPQDKRTQRARDLFWKAAQACDPVTLQDLPRALAVGNGVFEPDRSKLADFEIVKQHCDEAMTAPELKGAATRFKDE